MPLLRLTSTTETCNALFCQGVRRGPPKADSEPAPEGLEPLAVAGTSFCVLLGRVFAVKQEDCPTGKPCSRHLERGIVFKLKAKALFLLHRPLSARVNQFYILSAFIVQNNVCVLPNVHIAPIMLHSIVPILLSLQISVVVDFCKNFCQ